MIDSTLRRTVLAAAAVAALSFPAVAQSDAAFAAALGKPLPALAAMAQLQTQPQKPAAAPAQVKGPAAPADVWAKVLAVAKLQGAKTQYDPQFNLYALLDFVYDAPHATEYYLGAYALSSDTAQNIVKVNFSARDTTEIPGTRLVSFVIWTFTTDASGRLTLAECRKGSKTVGTVSNPLIVSVEKLYLDDPKGKARFDETLRYWAEHKP